MDNPATGRTPPKQPATEGGSAATVGAVGRTHRAAAARRAGLSVMTGDEGVLVTAAAVVGHRPVHGELWLFDDGLLYRRLGVRRTLGQLRTERGRRAPPQTVDPAERPRQRITAAERDEIAAADAANRWVARGEVRSARLRRRLTVTRLWLDLAGGGRLVLAWPRREQATPAVEAHLRGWLGADLDAR